MTSLRPRALAVLLAAALWAAQGGVARAQEPSRPADPDLAALKQAYDYGQYEQALERARTRIDRGGLSASELAELHKYAGLAAFNLNRLPDAERHLTALLRLEPDHNLDPFAVAPPAISFFEELRKKLEPQLELIRQQQRLEAERLKREAEERAQRQRDEEERRRRLEELSRRVTVRNVEKKSFLVNFVPFGAGQFQQNRTAAGVVLAATEGAMALTSIIAYLAYDALIERQAVEVETVSGRMTRYVYGIPREREQEANTWRIIKYASAGAFYTLYGYGVVDAIYHHEDEVVTTTTLQLPPELDRPAQPTRPPPEPQRDEEAPEKKEKDTVPLGPGVTGSASPSLSPTLHPFVFPTPGGVGAGFQLQF